MISWVDSKSSYTSLLLLLPINLFLILVQASIELEVQGI